MKQVEINVELYLYEQFFSRFATEHLFLMGFLTSCFVGFFTSLFLELEMMYPPVFCDV